MGALKDSIAAVATPPGEGGVAIIRISGPEAAAIANKVFSGNVPGYPSHTAHYGKVVDKEGCHLDSALLLPLLGSCSYTGEDTVEIQCHGGSLVTRRVLEAVLEAGARLAEPGEFTLRAFMNGKLDLVQAEAVQELICAKNSLALQSAQDHLAGRLSKKVVKFQKSLTRIAAILEAWVDFPEEGLEFASHEEITSELEKVAGEITELLATYHHGKMAKEGLSVCLVGAPNVGKSSLMNALLGKERAIVTATPGTTRDTLEDEMRLGPFHLHLIDTAGIRKTKEIIEQEGIRRAHEAISQADLILWVCDLSREPIEEERELFATLPHEKTIGIWNKQDLEGAKTLELPNAVTISAKKRLGLDQLTAQVEALIWRNGPPSKEEIWITSSRHKQSLKLALKAAQRACDGLKRGVFPEMLCLDLRQALIALGALIGTDVTEDILSEIFSTFCVGK